MEPQIAQILQLKTNKLIRVISAWPVADRKFTVKNVFKSLAQKTNERV